MSEEPSRLRIEAPRYSGPVIGLDEPDHGMGQDVEQNDEWAVHRTRYMTL